MNYILFDDKSWEDLLPLTFTRPVSELRTGILTIREKWEARLVNPTSSLTRPYLQGKFPLRTAPVNILINGAVFPSRELVKEIGQLEAGEALGTGDDIIAARLDEDGLSRFTESTTLKYKRIRQIENVGRIRFPWDIFRYNGTEIRNDYKMITDASASHSLSPTNNLLGIENIYAEEGVRAEFATINAERGPVYLGKDSEIMEGAVIRGPFALCEGSTVKMGAKIYGPSTVGPFSKVGGEINNSVIQGYSNKAHDGFLGHSVLGEWCNIGADTNNSNLKNNYAPVRVWNYRLEKFSGTGLTFCGLIMGDHSKCGINTMFNTGTVVGVNANIYGTGFPRNFIPSFSWGGAGGFKTYELSKAFGVAERVMKRREIDFDQTEREILTSIFEMTGKYRKN